MIAGSSRLTQVKPKAKVKSKATYESESGEEDLSSEIVNVVKRMIRRRRFAKRKIMKVFKKREKGEVRCYHYNKKGQFKLECPQFQE